MWGQRRWGLGDWGWEGEKREEWKRERKGKEVILKMQSSHKTDCDCVGWEMNQNQKNGFMTLYYYDILRRSTFYVVTKIRDDETLEAFPEASRELFKIPKLKTFHHWGVVIVTDCEHGRIKTLCELDVKEKNSQMVIQSSVKVRQNQPNLLVKSLTHLFQEDFSLELWETACCCGITKEPVTVAQIREVALKHQLNFKQYTAIQENCQKVCALVELDFCVGDPYLLCHVQPPLS